MKPGPASATVITMTTTPDRLSAFMAGWAAAGAPLPLNVHCSEPGLNGLRGCFEAHQAVLEAAGDDTVLVLEDDAVFAPEFTLEVDWPDDADLFYLGGEQQRGASKPGAARVRRTHGYVAWNPGGLAATLAQRRWQRQPIDGALTQLPLRRYVASPFTIGQRGGTPSSLRGTVYAEDQYWNQ